MKFLTLEQLTSGMKERNVGADRGRLVEKWSRTGLLRGLDGYKRETMAQLLENQAAQVLKESNALSSGGGAVASSGQIQGFSNIAFPIVRRVFGGLVSNDLVSIQPMSLPSGLIFYLDYTYGSAVGTTQQDSGTFETYTRGQSIYNNPTGRGVQSGSLAAGGMYDLVGAGYSKVHSGTMGVSGSTTDVGAWGGVNGDTWTTGLTVSDVGMMTGTNGRFLQFDPQINADLDTGTLDCTFAHLSIAQILTNIPKGDFLAVDQISIFGFATTNGAVAWGDTYQAGRGVMNLRRLTKRGNWASSVFTPSPLNGTHVQVVLRVSNGGSVPVLGATTRLSMAIADVVASTAGDGGGVGSTLTIPSFETDFGATPSPAIPEIDIKIESIAITATTRKLRARWSPELAQDLNAYHSMDAEVELTSILSEQIALEIDREILQDIVTQANGANFYWSRAPGRFVNKLTGSPIQLANSLSIGPQFTGNVREWYETLIETIIDVANTIHRKTLRGSANFIVVGPDVATIIEATTLYKAKISIDGEGQVNTPFTIGAEAIGTVSNRFTIYKDPYFPRNKVLVGYKGGSYLETGYVYSPYVPVMVTPTIFRPEDFAPTKAVLTRYGKKMVRSDFYGTVQILDMNII
jgi:hypothetical protein